ncbi:redoxin domain-containing protein [uncultured Gimesia sp.]|uniref:peroxiredoxin family protein n=1 Tax=uncultured Gimesia sp. TaxID=1678688 RepID=UPI0030DC4124|tara:strand:- start:658 stop:1404 length:747 start_codon:yes stop_codon:yes gene_type:complete
MSGETYNLILMVIMIGVMIAIGVLVFSFGFMILRWNTAKRRGHVIRLLLSMAAVLCLLGTQQAVQWWIFMPSLAKEQMKVINEARAEEFAKTSVVQVGDAAPDFSLMLTNGEAFSLSAARGDVVLINFYSNWCGPCRLELPHFQQIWEARKNNLRFRMLVIGREETTESVQEFCKENGFTFPAAADPDRGVYSLFAKESIPRTLVISPEGTILFYTAGFYEPDLKRLEVMLDQQLAKLPADQNETAAE